MPETTTDRSGGRRSPLADGFVRTPRVHTPGSRRARGTRRSALPVHCWVVDVDVTPGRVPGLLLEWRRSADDGWEGRVVMPLPRDDGSVGVEAWVAAENLRPVEAHDD
jgi:hypothetical protein